MFVHEERILGTLSLLFSISLQRKEVSGTSLCPAHVIPSKEPKASPQFWFAKRKVAFIFISRLFFVQFQLHLPLGLPGCGLSIICINILVSVD